jgi:hypothetical protein
MIRPGENVLLDTTAIIEAHRQGVWEPLVNGFRLATVEKCIEENVTWYQDDQLYGVDNERQILLYQGKTVTSSCVV